ncbi:MAG TPA: hypothetical protein VKV95_04240 [Terriglobia bacterium]|nr:hypothetical protein [Terriglobia bacterium]
MAQEPPAPARLTFTKVLAGSTPEFEEITVDSNGSGAYDGRKLSEPASPRSIQLSSATTQKVFALAHSLNDFKSIDLESHKKVANLGQKTFSYEQGGVKNQAEFNYSLRREAQELAEVFERIGTVEEHAKALEYDSKYDPLSLPKELLLIQIDMDNKGLVDPELMTPVLEQISRNSHLLHLAQARAQDILQRIHSEN